MRFAGWFRRHSMAPVIFLVLLGVTYLAWQHERNTLALEQQAMLDASLREASSRIEQRMVAYGQMLRGVQGLFLASRQVERDEFRLYIDSLHLGADFAGLYGVGFAALVPAAGKSRYIASLRAQGLPAHAITPPGERAVYAPQSQLEPEIGENRFALGFDGYTDPGRRAAMERARDSGVMAMTGMVKLASSPGGTQRHGFVLYYPIYQKGARTDSPAARRANLKGWAFAPLSVKDLMASLYGEDTWGTGISIHDGVDMSGETLIYQSHESPAMLAKDRIGAIEYVVIGGHTWTLNVYARNGDGPLGLHDKSWLIAITGMGLSFLLATLTWVLATGRSRAQALAAKMTYELRASEARFRHLAQHDVLTGIPNRALFSDRLALAISHARRYNTRLALMYIDLDNFKPVNDSLGHHCGDQLLSAVARRMQEVVRESDTLARMGGDEFAVLLPAIQSDQDALAVAEKIRLALELPFDLEDGHRIRISSSTGVAFYPEHGGEETQLAKSADAALYLAKALGRNRVAVFSASA